MKYQPPEWFKELVPAHIDHIPEYKPGKPVSELLREFGIKDAIKMASNENPLGPSPKAVAAIKSLLNKIHVYPEDAPLDLRTAIAEKFGITKDSVILGNGSDEILALISHLLVTPGSEVITGEHSFSMYRILAESYGGANVRTPMPGYSFDLSAIYKAINEKTRIIYFTIPNNPTGTIINSADFESFLDDLPENGPTIVLDEAYREYVRDSSCVNGIEYLLRDYPILVLRTFSKAYGLAGLRIGYGLAQPWLISYLNKIRAPFTVNALAECGARAALEDGQHLAKTIECNIAGMETLTKELTSMGFHIIPSQANFVSFSVGPKAEEIYKRLLQYGVIVRHLGSFGLPEFLRVTIGLPHENSRLINALKRALAELG